MKSFIYVEPSAEGIGPITKQIASGVRRVAAELRGPLTGLIVGDHLDGKESELGELFDEVVKVDIPSAKISNTEVISKILTDVVRENGPAILFLGFTHQGMELGPAVGWRLGVPVITNCAGLDWTERGALVRRPIQGGKFFISLAAKLEGGAVLTVQKGAWKEDGSMAGGQRSVPVNRIAWRDSWAEERTEVLGIKEEGLEGEEDITKADILVSVGRGLGDPENLPVMRELAERLGGMISCSRPVVDLGWLPATRQVGISGRTVTPVVYLALGISGQTNHLAGMDGSRIIIAVNKDPSAPIFGVAKYGMVEDILELVPELLEQAKRGD